MHMQIATYQPTLNKIHKCPPRFPVLRLVRCCVRVPPTPDRPSCVSQTGEAELAAREIAPQLQTLEIAGHGDTVAGIHGPGPG